ncbi:MAG: DNA-processing protein DprA [Candidatus Symbiodolus clandestinus]
MELNEWWLRLSLIPNLWPDRLATLAEPLQAIQGLEGLEQLRAAGLTAEQCQAFLEPPQRLANAKRWLQHPQHRLLTRGNPEYPERLRHLPDPPLLLFTVGEISLLQAPQCALVGSRQATPYGIHWGEHFSSELASSGLVITSGLAIGIDAICHQASLEIGGKTIAVLGNGLQTPYPRCHQPLAERILEQGGLLISEYCPDTPPKPFHFPRRNRLISGLSLGVLVVEASLRSGSLITARHALEQGREVFALPGDLAHNNSQGCHQLIRQGAWLVTQPMEVLEVLNSSLNWISLPPPAVAAAREESILTGDDERLGSRALLMQIGNEATPIDLIKERAGQPLTEVLQQLLDLELSGRIKAIPGGYVRCKR